MSFVLTAENYYGTEANEHYWSASQIKSMMDCPARTIAEMRGEYVRPSNIALLVGSYVDAHFEGTLDIFRAKHPEIFKKDGGLKSEYILAEKMIARAERDEVFMSYMDGEKQVIKTATIFGLPFKCKYDVYKSGERIVDLKTTKDFNPLYKEGQGRLSFAEFWNWPLQMAIYQAVEGNNLPCYLAALTKQDPPDIGVFQIPQYQLDAEMLTLKSNIEYYDAIKHGVIDAPRCEKCAYCRETKKLTGAISLEEFSETESEEEE